MIKIKILLFAVFVMCTSYSAYAQAQIGIGIKGLDMTNVKGVLSSQRLRKLCGKRMLCF